MINQRELLALRNELPKDWVHKVVERTSYSQSRIRETLRFPNKYNKEIIDAAIEVAKQHKVDADATISSQKQQIKALAS